MPATPLFMIKNIFEKEMFPIIQAMSGTYKQDNGANMLPFSAQLTEVINRIVTDKTCTDIIITLNTDKIPFGVYVNPTLIDSDLNNIIFDPGEVNLTRYTLEIDTKLFDILTPAEIAAYIIEDITTTMSSSTIDNVRALIETIMADRDLSINVRQSVNFSQLLIFGIKDTIRKVSSLIYKPTDEDGVNEYAVEFDYAGVMPYIAEKLHTNIKDTTNIDVSPKLSVLSWVLSVYNDPSTNYELMIDTLSDALVLTGSRLEAAEVKKTIIALQRAVNETLIETTIRSFREGLSIFKNLKQNGLRSIEDDLYEYKIRVKTCETEDDAMYILHQISTRINILEDYMYNTPDLSDSEIKRWTNVIVAYKNLRFELGKKPVVDKKRYGVYVDYDAIDKLEFASGMTGEVLDESFFHSNLAKWIPKLKKIKDEKPDSSSTPREVKQFVDRYYDDIVKLSKNIEEYPENYKPDALHRLTPLIISCISTVVFASVPVLNIISLLSMLVTYFINGLAVINDVKETSTVMQDAAKIRMALKKAAGNRKLSQKDKKRINTLIDKMDDALGDSNTYNKNADW